MRTAMELASFKNEEGRNNNKAPSSSPNDANNEQHGLRFYDPASILDVSRELAFGYLILLTGGAVEYAPPPPAQAPPSTAEENSRISSQSPHPPPPAADDDIMYASSSSAPVDEESASLAYSAIVDGNVLHACFGLRASASGRSSIPTIGGHRDERPSAFCCFPASSSSSGGALDATLQLVLPHLVGNKVRMANLVEMLREVRDLHHEEAYRGDHHVAAAYAAAGAANDATTTSGAKEAPLYVRVIRAYVRCFTAIVGYHDARRELVGKNDAAVVATTGDGGAGGRTTRGGGGIVARCAKVFARCFAKPKIDPRLEMLRAVALMEISTGFIGLGEDISQSLENTATESAITTGMSSVEGSTSSVVERGGKR